MLVQVSEYRNVLARFKPARGKFNNVCIVQPIQNRGLVPSGLFSGTKPVVTV